MQHKRTLCLAFWLLSAAASAAQWQKCDLRVKITTVGGQQLQGEVVQLLKRSPAKASCPAPGATLRFAPESEDYQRVLARRHWPRKGQVIHMRYQYLDGICKARGPCRIEHYPLPGR